MATTDDYVALITGQHQDKPKFRAVIEALTAGFVSINNGQSALIEAFDLDAAEGVQLDKIGEWIGVSRNLTTPLTDVYFTWDGEDLVGWDSGTWQGRFDPVVGLTVLPDDSYRVLLRARAAANAWGGTIPEAAEIWRSAFAGEQDVIIQDNQDMTMVLGLVGAPLTAVSQALLIGGYLPLKPVGVRVAYYAIPVGSGPLFGWDAETPTLDGWETGSWAKLLSPS